MANGPGDPRPTGAEGVGGKVPSLLGARPRVGVVSDEASFVATFEESPEAPPAWSFDEQEDE